jgi:hypothetical protein
LREDDPKNDAKTTLSRPATLISMAVGMMPSVLRLEMPVMDVMGTILRVSWPKMLE